MIEPAAANMDDAAVASYALGPLSLDGSPTLPADIAEARAARDQWLERFAVGLYGHLPPPPDRLTWQRHELPDAHCERVAIRLDVGGRVFTVDAALWLPAERNGPVPLVAGLDFLGPLGTLFSNAYPLDPDARVAQPGWRGGGEGPLDETLRGTSGHRVPISTLLGAGFGVLTSCYGSWVPDDASTFRQHGLWPLLGLDSAANAPGAVGLWAWALMRLVDIAVQLPEIDADRITLFGHSRLGKAALWAAANDERVETLLLNESGCGGASLSSRNFGETLALNRFRFPHWLLSEEQAAIARLDELDQHHLLACLAPRRLYVASAAADLWCDPKGEYLGLAAAAPFWQVFGSDNVMPDLAGTYRPGNRVTRDRLGWHLREGGHELLPYDWERFADFLTAGKA